MVSCAVPVGVGGLLWAKLVGEFEGEIGENGVDPQLSSRCPVGRFFTCDQGPGDENSLASTMDELHIRGRRPVPHINPIGLCVGDSQGYFARIFG